MTLSSKAVERAIAQCTSRWAMARGHRLNTSIVLAAVHGLSGLFRAVSAVEPLAACVSVEISDDKPVTTDYCSSLIVGVDPDTRTARQVSDATVRSGTVAIASARSLLRDTVDK